MTSGEGQFVIDAIQRTIGGGGGGGGGSSPNWGEANLREGWNTLVGVCRIAI